MKRHYNMLPNDILTKSICGMGIIFRTKPTCEVGCARMRMLLANSIPEVGSFLRDESKMKLFCTGCSDFRSSNCSTGVHTLDCRQQAQGKNIQRAIA
jgi:hypothetical protein